MLVVETGDSGTQRLDTGSRTVFTSSGGDRNGFWARETTLDAIVGLGSTLAQVRPFGGVLGVTVFGGTLCTPDNTGRGTGRIKTSVRTVTLVGTTELTVSLGSKL